MARERSTSKASCYRELFQEKCDGQKVCEYTLEIWRREDELLRSVIEYGPAYVGCGLTRRHFDAPVHGLAWDAMMGMIEKDPSTAKLDSRAVVAEMTRMDPDVLPGRLGMTWVDGVMSDPPLSAEYGLDTVVLEIKHRHRNRMFAAKFQQISSRVGKDVDSPSIHAEYLSASSEVVRGAEEDRMFPDPFFEAEGEAWDANTSVKPRVLATGLKELDETTGGGIGLGEMMVIGGGTGHGKSYFCQRLVRNQAIQEQPVVYFSCEDPSELFFCRMIADYTEPKVSPKNIRLRKVDPEIVFDAIKRCSADTRGKVWVEHNMKPSADLICQRIRAYRHAKGVKMVIVDYVQAMTDGENATNNKVQEISSVIAKLKRTAKECEVALVLISQYARDSYRDGTEPGINSFKYCGDIENESEVVVLTWKDEEGVLHLRIPKVKWARGDEFRYTIDIDPVTGCHGDWRDDYKGPEDEEDEEEQKGKGKGKGKGRRQDGRTN